MTDDRDILTAVARHLDDRMRFERVRPHRGRTYYRLLADDRPSAVVMDATRARETIAYWRAKGWILTDDPRQPRLPGDVGAVRDVEIPDPHFALPAAAPADFTLTAECGRAAQPALPGVED